MKIKVLYFGALRDMVPAEEEELEVPTPVLTVGDFLPWVEGQRPALKGRLGAVRVARNEVFATASERLGEGDVLALLPPVAGG